MSRRAVKHMARSNEGSTHGDELDAISRQTAVAGRTAAQIAKTLGVTRNAVIGRSRRLRGIVYQSDIDSWTRANARRAEEARKRAQLRRVAQRKALRDLARAVARGVPAGKAMSRAHKAGALWRQIGDYFGISQQAAYERAKTWTQRSRS
jgi:hypothetical protein